jgi:hypothetical protein
VYSPQRAGVEAKRGQSCKSDAQGDLDDYRIGWQRLCPSLCAPLCVPFPLCPSMCASPCCTYVSSCALLYVCPFIVHMCAA